MIKKAIRIIGVAAAILAVAAVALLLFLGSVVKFTVDNVLPRMLGVPVTVEKVSFSALRGTLDIRGFEIGNPEGFDKPYLLHSDRFHADLHVREILLGRCHFQEILVLGPRVWYHRKLTESNLSVLLDGLDSKSAEEKEKRDKAKGKDKGKKEKDGKKSSVVIDHFLFDEGTVGIKMGAGVEVPLAKVELKDIGKDGSFMAVQIVRVIFGAVFDSVLHAVSAVGGAAVDAVSTVGGAAVDAVGTAAEAVGDAAGSLIKGVGSLFGGDKSE